VPDPGNSQDWDRYAYSINNPLRYIDPSGHCTGDSTDPDNPDKPCWDLYFDILGMFGKVLSFLDSTFNYDQLAQIFGAMDMVANIFHRNMDAFKEAFGTFSIYHLPQIEKYGALGITPPGFNVIFLGNNFITRNVIHELGHIFDFKGSNMNPDLYKSQLFVGVFGSGCNTGWLGCYGDSHPGYQNWWNIGGRGDGYKPNYDETSQYGMGTSIDDFADTFTAYVLEQNGREYNGDISPWRKIIIGLLVDLDSP
jgi:hypothetical protein